MFRRLESSLPPDFHYEASLEKLGYFINDKDQIRMISDPEQPFHYYISKNERCVEMQKEAVNESIRQIVKQRLLEKGLEPLNLPLGALDSEPHVPILVSKDLQSCKKVIVYLGESCQDLGILAGRIISRETIHEGSLLQFVQSIQKSPYIQTQDTGIVIANPGQLLWYRRGRKPLSLQSWNAIPRKSAVSAPLEYTKKNRIPKNEDYARHTACVLDDVVLPLANKGCSVFVVGAGDSGLAAFEYLQDNWAESWKDKIEALVLTGLNFVMAPKFLDLDFHAWWGRRGRAYLVSDQPVLTPLKGRSRLGCNIFASGEGQYVECVVRSACAYILDYFKFIMQHEGYENPVQHEDDADSDDTGETVEIPAADWGWGASENAAKEQSAQEAENIEGQETDEVKGGGTEKTAEVIESSLENVHLTTEQGIDLDGMPK